MIGRELKLITGNANIQLAREVSDALGVDLCDTAVERFNDGEIRVRIRETVRGADVFVIQPTSPPVNDHLMELLIIIDALRRASARQVIAVIPYYGYARQDRRQTHGARSDYGQTCGQPDRDSRSGPRFDDGSPRWTDSRFFQRTGR